MAARKNKLGLDENWRKKIQASMLINRLEDHALGIVEMTNTQISAAKILLDKVVSNAPTEVKQETEHSGTVHVEHSKRPKLSRDEWLKLNGLN